MTKDENVVFIDRDGCPIRVGDTVIWYDPEEESRDLYRKYSVWKMKGDIVYISDGKSEAEVLPCELEVII